MQNPDAESGKSHAAPCSPSDVVTAAVDRLSRDTSHAWKTGGRARSQLALGQGVAQHFFDAGIVALAGRPYALNDIGGQAEPDMDLRRCDRRATHPLPRLELLGKDLLERLRPREILFGPFRDFRLVPILL